MARGSKPTPVSAADRAAIVAAYHLAGNVEKVSVPPYGVGVVRRVLREEGMTDRRPINRPPAALVGMADAIEPLWRAGETYKTIRREIGIGIGNDKIRLLMHNIPRGEVASQAVAVAAGAALTDDVLVWAWFSGVFDHGGIISRHPDNGYPMLAVRVGRRQELAESIRANIGTGTIGRASRDNPTFEWRLARRADTRQVLERILPHLRVSQSSVRRSLAEMDELDAKGGAA